MTILLTNDAIKSIKAAEPDIQSKVATVIQNLASLNLETSKLVSHTSIPSELPNYIEDSNSENSPSKYKVFSNIKVNLNNSPKTWRNDYSADGSITGIGSDVYTFKNGDYLVFFTVMDKSNVVVLDVKNYKSIENKKIKELRSKLASAYSDALYENAKNTSRKIISNEKYGDSKIKK